MGMIEEKGGLEFLGLKDGRILKKANQNLQDFQNEQNLSDYACKGNYDKIHSNRVLYF